MASILVIGASGFVGRHLARTLISQGHAVRCLARDVSRIAELAQIGCTTVQGDISDPASMQRAFVGVDAAYIAVHTISPQPKQGQQHDFMDIELQGLQHIVAAARANNVQRLIYITFLGTTPNSASAWVRGRWQAEQLLMTSGIDTTVIRPGQIVGVGGRGFDTMVMHAKKRVCVIFFGNGAQRMRTIAIDDLVYYLCGVLPDKRTHGQAYDVGSDDVLSVNAMIDGAAELLGLPHPLKINLPPTVLRAAASPIESVTKLPPGALRGILDSLGVDAVGDPMPIRALLPRELLSYRESARRALFSRS